MELWREYPVLSLLSFIKQLTNTLLSVCKSHSVLTRSAPSARAVSHAAVLRFLSRPDSLRTSLALREGAEHHQDRDPPQRSLEGNLNDANTELG